MKREEAYCEHLGGLWRPSCFDKIKEVSISEDKLHKVCPMVKEHKKDYVLFQPWVDFKLKIVPLHGW
jgi:hypothetical protein